MRDYIGRARILRATIEKLATEHLDDKDAVANVELFPSWTSGMSYSVGDRVRYDGVLYSALQAHTSQSDWTPDVAPSLFAKVLIPDHEVIPEWEQPSSTNPYMKGDRVSYLGKIWESTIDNNVWAPSVYGWEEVTTNA